jgi:hypothetical protein
MVTKDHAEKIASKLKGRKHPGGKHEIVAIVSFRYACVAELARADK